MKNYKWIIIVIFIILLIALLSIILINKTNKPYIVKESNLKITYENNNEIISNIKPGFTETKNFTVENTSDKEIIYKIRWNYLNNNLKDKFSLVNSIKQNKKYLLQETQVLESNKNYPIVFDIVIKPHEKHKYIFKITYKKQEYDQKKDLNKKIEGKLEIVLNDKEDGYFLKDKEYSISYNLNGGYLKSENPKTYNSQSSSITLKNPIKTGYKFSGWSGTDLANKTSLVIIPEGSSGNKRYTANYEPIMYIINLNNNLKSKNKKSLKVYYDEKIELPKNELKKEGYVFKGWSLEKNGEVTYKDKDKIENLTIKDKDIVNLYPVWEKTK